MYSEYYKTLVSLYLWSIVFIFHKIFSILNQLLLFMFVEIFISFTDFFIFLLRKGFNIFHETYCSLSFVNLVIFSQWIFRHFDLYGKKNIKKLMLKKMNIRLFIALLLSIFYESSPKNRLIHSSIVLLTLFQKLQIFFSKFFD